MATNNLTEHNTEVADAIRSRKGTTEKISPQNFATEIRNLPSGGLTVESANVIIGHGDTWVPDRENAVWIFNRILHDNDYAEGHIEITTVDGKTYDTAFPSGGSEMIIVNLSQENICFIAKYSPYTLSDCAFMQFRPIDHLAWYDMDSSTNIRLYGYCVSA